ncbi:Ig-like domain-containing protein [Pantoea septica]|uniref:Ig-like domain-containing protein n=1 Tax=Pantoea septica TaxID=472695 RepID=UPI0036F223DC
MPDGTQTTAQTDSEGNWCAKAPTSQSNGTLIVTVTDGAGNSASLTDEYHDVAPPEAAVISINDSEQLAGKAEPGAKIILTDGSTGKTITVDVDENGNWNVHSNPVNEGNHDVSFTVVDPEPTIAIVQTPACHTISDLERGFAST